MASFDPSETRPTRVLKWNFCSIAPQTPITEGKLFRAIRHERLVEPLSDWSVREIVRRRAQLADQPLGKLSAHSLRSGFVTEAGKQGLSLGQTMAMTGHRSVQTVMGYYQGGELSTSKAARLLEPTDE
ncbi:MAG: hypothetical protein ACREU2_03205 [Steroidobacteraceae bacterium]